MMKQTRNGFCFYLRATAMFVLIAFTSTTVAWSAPSLSLEPIALSHELKISSLAGRIEIPSELGSIKEIYTADKTIDLGSGLKPQGSGLIVHLEDAHGSVEAQLHQEEILRHLQKQYGLNTIFVEGGLGDLRPELLHFFKDSQLNDKLMDKLTDAGLVGGVERFLATESPEPTLDHGPQNTIKTKGDSRGLTPKAYGVEDAKLYRRELELFREVYDGKPVSDKFLGEMRQSLLAQSAASFNKELKTFFREWLFQEELQKNMLSHLSFLQKYAQEALQLDLTDAREQYDWPMMVRFFKLKELEKNAGNVERETANEKEKLLKWIAGKELKAFMEIGDLFTGVPSSPFAVVRGQDFRSMMEKFYAAASPLGFKFEDYPALSRSIGRKILCQELQIDELVLEMGRLNAKVLDALAKTPEEKKGVAEYQEYLLLRKLFSLELTRGEYARLKAEPRGTGNGERRTISLPVTRYPFPAKAALEFYEIAEQREQSMFSNMLAKMKETKQPNAVLITGGFHSEGLSEVMKQSGMSYVRIAPRISGKVDDSNYLRVMTLGHSGSTARSSARFAPIMSGPEAFDAATVSFVHEELRTSMKEIAGDRIPDVLPNAWLASEPNIPPRRLDSVGEAGVRVEMRQKEAQREKPEEFPLVSAEGILQFFGRQFPELAPFVAFLEGYKGQSGRVGEGYHSFGHGLELAYVNFLVLRSMGFSENELRESHISAALHDFDVREGMTPPKVSRTLEQIKGNPRLQGVFRGLGISGEAVELLIQRTDHPWTEQRKDEWERRLANFPQGQQASLRRRAAILQFLDKASGFLFLDPEAYAVRSRELYKENKAGEVSAAELIRNNRAFMESLKKDPVFQEVFDHLPAWAKEHWQKNDVRPEMRKSAEQSLAQVEDPAVAEYKRIFSELETSDLEAFKDGIKAEEISLKPSRHLVFAHRLAENAPANASMDNVLNSLRLHLPKKLWEKLRVFPAHIRHVTFAAGSLEAHPELGTDLPIFSEAASVTPAMNGDIGRLAFFAKGNILVFEFDPATAQDLEAIDLLNGELLKKKPGLSAFKPRVRYHVTASRTAKPLSPDEAKILMDAVADVNRKIEHPQRVHLDHATLFTTSTKGLFLDHLVPGYENLRFKGATILALVPEEPKASLAAETISSSDVATDWLKTEEWPDPEAPVFMASGNSKIQAAIDAKKGTPIYFLKQKMQHLNRLLKIVADLDQKTLVWGEGYRDPKGWGDWFEHALNGSLTAIQTNFEVLLQYGVWDADLIPDIRKALAKAEIVLDADEALASAIGNDFNDVPQYWNAAYTEKGRSKETPLTKIEQMFFFPNKVFIEDPDAERNRAIFVETVHRINEAFSGLQQFTETQLAKYEEGQAPVVRAEPSSPNIPTENAGEANTVRAEARDLTKYPVLLGGYLDPEFVAKMGNGTFRSLERYLTLAGFTVVSRIADAKVPPAVAVLRLSSASTGDTIRALKSENKDVKIILLTGGQDSFSQAALEEMGAHRIIYTPLISAVELTDPVHEFITLAEAAPDVPAPSAPEMDPSCRYQPMTGNDDAWIEKLFGKLEPWRLKELRGRFFREVQTGHVYLAKYESERSHWDKEDFIWGTKDSRDRQLLMTDLFRRLDGNAVDTVIPEAKERERIARYLGLDTKKSAMLHLVSLASNYKREDEAVRQRDFKRAMTRHLVLAVFTRWYDYHTGNHGALADAPIPMTFDHEQALNPELTPIEKFTRRFIPNYFGNIPFEKMLSMLDLEELARSVEAVKSLDLAAFREQFYQDFSRRVPDGSAPTFIFGDHFKRLTEWQQNIEKDMFHFFEGLFSDPMLNSIPQDSARPLPTLEQIREVLTRSEVGTSIPTAPVESDSRAEMRKSPSVSDAGQKEPDRLRIIIKKVAAAFAGSVTGLAEGAMFFYAFCALEFRSFPAALFVASVTLTAGFFAGRAASRGFSPFRQFLKKWTALHLGSAAALVSGDIFFYGVGFGALWAGVLSLTVTLATAYGAFFVFDWILGHFWKFVKGAVVITPGVIMGSVTGLILRRVFASLNFAEILGAGILTALIVSWMTYRFFSGFRWKRFLLQIGLASLIAWLCCERSAYETAVFGMLGHNQEEVVPGWSWKYAVPPFHPGSLYAKAGYNEFLRVIQRLVENENFLVREQRVGNSVGRFLQEHFGIIPPHVGRSTPEEFCAYDHSGGALDVHRRAAIFPSFDKVSEVLKRLLFFQENQKFEEKDNPIIEWKGLARIYRNKFMDLLLFRESRRAGASTTLTQLAKFDCYGPTKTAEDKLRQMVTAELGIYSYGILPEDMRRAKEEQALQYLNGVYLGSLPGYGHVRGFAEAAYAFFGKSPEEMTPQEWAFLVAAVRRPSSYMKHFQPDLEQWLLARGCGPTPLWIRSPRGERPNPTRNGNRR